MEQNSTSLYRAIAFALGRKREQSHQNVRREVCEWLMDQGDRPVLAPDIVAKHGILREHNLVKHLFNKLGWENVIEELADENRPGNHISLLGACCKYQTKICLISAAEEWPEPIWLAPPELWTRDQEAGSTHEQVRLERSPLFIAHLHDSQFFAIETAAQHARNELPPIVGERE